MRNKDSVLLDKFFSKTSFAGKSGVFLAIVLIVHALLIAMMMRPAAYTAQITPPMMGMLLGSSADSASGPSTSTQDLAKSSPAQKNSLVTSSQPPFSPPENHQTVGREMVPAPTSNKTGTQASRSNTSVSSSDTAPLPSHASPSGSAFSSTGTSTSVSSGAAGSGGNSLTLPNSDAGHLNNPKPLYSAVSRKMGEEGQVLLSVYILADGNVGKVTIKKSSGYQRLDESALTAVRNWRYVPARMDGKAIPYWYTQPVLFSLND